MRKLPIAVVAVVILLIVVGWTAGMYIPMGGNHRSTGASSSSISSTSSATASSTLVSSTSGVSTNLGSSQSTSGNWLVDSPTFIQNSSKIDYPPDYGVLANFTLAVINADRAAANVDPVTMSTVPSAQQHADSMAYYGYFSHWDNQGYKPYMRYTILGGTGSMTENVALNYCTSSSPNSTKATPALCTIQTVENAINASEGDMMNNDTTCCSDGHRDNILGPIHNQVSVGVAYNSTTVYLVEDFEDNYISSESLQLSGGVVTFNGSIQSEGPGWMTRMAGAEITVYFDPSPINISLSSLAISSECSQYNELNESASCRYEGSYNAGTQVSTVFPPCPSGDVCVGGNYTYAQTWQYNKSGSFNIVFSMSALEAAHGNGVYTFYLWPTETVPEPVTSLSIFSTGG